MACGGSADRDGIAKPERARARIAGAQGKMGGDERCATSGQVFGNQCLQQLAALGVQSRTGFVHQPEGAAGLLPGQGEARQLQALSLPLR